MSGSSGGHNCIMDNMRQQDQNTIRRVFRTPSMYSSHKFLLKKFTFKIRLQLQDPICVILPFSYFFFLIVFLLFLINLSVVFITHFRLLFFSIANLLSPAKIFWQHTCSMSINTQGYTDLRISADEVVGGVKDRVAFYSYY